MIKELLPELMNIQEADVNTRALFGEEPFAPKGSRARIQALSDELEAEQSRLFRSFHPEGEAGAR